MEFLQLFFRSIKEPKLLRGIGTVKLFTIPFSFESDQREYVVVDMEDTEDELYCPAVIRLAVSVRVRAERGREESRSGLPDQGKEN